MNLRPIILGVIVGVLAIVGMAAVTTGPNNTGTNVINTTIVEGGGAQTPWTSDIDASTFSITNLATLRYKVIPDGSSTVPLVTLNDAVLGEVSIFSYKNNAASNHVLYIGDSAKLDAASIQIKDDSGDPRITFVVGDGFDYSRRTWRWRDQFLETGDPFQNPELAPRIFQHDGYGNAAIPRQMKITTNSITAPTTSADSTNLTQLSIIGKSGEVWQFEYHIYVAPSDTYGSQVFLSATNSPTYVNYTINYVTSTSDVGAAFFAALDQPINAGIADPTVDYCIKGTVKFSGTDYMTPKVSVLNDGTGPVVLEGSYLRAVKHFQAPSVYSPTAYVAP